MIKGVVNPFSYLLKCVVFLKGGLLLPKDFGQMWTFRFVLKCGSIYVLCVVCSLFVANSLLVIMQHGDHFRCLTGDCCWCATMRDGQPAYSCFFAPRSHHQLAHLQLVDLAHQQLAKQQLAHLHCRSHQFVHLVHQSKHIKGRSKEHVCASQLF